MNPILQQLSEFGVIPVVKIEDADNAVALGNALIKGDLPVAEITFRTAAAEEAITRLSRELPDMLIGAGTVLSVEQVKKAVKAGAKFIVSPGFNPKVVGYCVENDIPITPGINSPTGIEMALEYNLEVVKFFPAEASGGLAMLKAMAAPYGGMSFIPTGGISEKNLNTYLAFPKILACGGSWMVKDSLIASGQFEEITRMTKEAVTAMLGFEIAHLGVNQESSEDALRTAQAFSSLFNFPVKEGNSSVFAGSGIEVTKEFVAGAHGHIAIGVNSIDRAVAYLKRKGLAIRPETAKEKNGKLIAVYLDTEIAGFALHLLQK